MLSTIEPGKRVRITQLIRGRAATWKQSIEGVVESVEQRPTGSWFTHGRDDRLWLQRLLLRRDDGEQTLIHLDPNTQITILP